MAQPLPDPQWTQSASICVACGYSLAGLSPSGQCPECGASYDAVQLVLFGVPNQSGNTPPLRRAIWMILIIGTVAQAYTWPLQIRYLGCTGLLATAASLAGGIIYMALSGPRERRGTERFIIASSGLARVAVKFDPAVRRLDTIFIPWVANDAVFISRISANWKRLKIGQLNEGLYGSLKSISFDAGFRCPDSQTDAVREAIQKHIAAARAIGPLPAPQSPTP